MALERIELEPGLEAYRCPKSGGVWIPLDGYENWRNGYRSGTHPLPPDYAPVYADDAKRTALLCPESGCVLVRSRVGQGLGFFVDRSPRTGGVWLDAGEWDALKWKGLHEDLHLIFSGPYQSKVVAETKDEQLRVRFENRIGNEDFQRVREFAQWMMGHPKRRDITAYLRDVAGDQR